ncbi:MAG TPA: hypothetical protein VGJ91_15350 [Polyangiaceae bacterium]|jgi:hypothetical protein
MALHCARGYTQSVFLTLMVIGLVGLAAMAFPAFGHSHGGLSGHGAGHVGVTHGVGHAAHGTANACAAPGARSALQQLLPADAVHHGLWRLVPSPRKVFSLLSLYGAFGNAARNAFHLSPGLAAVSAVLPALLIEWLLLRPLWNVLFRVQAAPSSPLEELISSEARAVVPFRNGRGMVSAIRDGRSVQLVASLREEQRMLPVKVGDRLVIEDVDAAQERVTVAFFPS